MINFDNDNSSEKSIRNAKEFGLLDTRLTPIVIWLAAKFRELGAVMTITSVHRTNSSDHLDYRAVDLRARDLPKNKRLSLEKMCNDEFPVPLGERPTLKYYDYQNSDYPPHFHLRVPR